MTTARVAVIGRLTSDVEEKSRSEKSIMYTTSLASNDDRSTKENPKTHFYPLTIFIHPDSKLPNHLNKGTQIGITSGRWQVTKKQNEQGENRTFHNLVVNGSDIELLGQPRNNQGENNSSNSSTPAGGGADGPWSGGGDDVPI